MVNNLLRRICWSACLKLRSQPPNSLAHGLQRANLQYQLSSKTNNNALLSKRVYSCQQRLVQNIADNSQSQKTHSAPFNDSKPFYAQILVNRVLYKSEDRSCLHIELNIENSLLNYEAGDHVAIYPTNEQSLVLRLAELCKVELDKETLALLLHNLEITAIPTQNVIAALSKYCTESKDAEFLQSLVTCKEKYESWVQKACRNVIHILEDIKSCRPPLQEVCKMLPILKPRYYSISSSSKLHRNCVHITAVIVQYKTKTGRLNKGVASTFLQTISKQKAAKVPIFIAKSKFHLVENASVPIIMVAAGTGLAPFRGFIQERQHMRNEGEKVGETLLYFGCRKRNEDFIYGDELQEYAKKGTISLKTAFSRDQQEKVYVTHLMEKDADLIWKLLHEQQAHFYICGDARNMAADVRNSLLKIIATKGNLNAENALQYLKEIEAQNRYSADVWG